MTDLHFEASRQTGPVLGREEFGDTMSSVAIECDVATALHTAASVEDISVVVATGDLTDHGTDAEYEAVRRWLGRASLPIVTIPGNHDHYGNLYAGSHGADVDVMRIADTSRYEAQVGPRWWARYLGGGLLIGLDWFSWRLGIDRDEQLSWLRALARAISGARGVVLAIHDELDDDDWSELRAALEPHRVKTLLSGHWHVSRVHHRRDYLGFSTGSGAFGGLHMGPPEARVITLSHDLDFERSRTVIGESNGWRVERLGGNGSSTRVTAETDLEIWSKELECRLHRSNGVVMDGELLLGGAYGDRPGGLLVWLSLATGEVLREFTLKEGCVGPLTSGRLSGRPICVYQSVDGSVGAVDWDGSGIWETKRRDSVLRYSQTGAVVGGGLVVVGDVRGVEALSLEDGRVVWSSGPIGRPENLISYGSPAVVGERAIVPLGGPGVGLVSFTLSDGKMIWSEDGGRGIPAASIAFCESLGYLIRSTGTLECFDVETGALVWSEAFAASLGGPAPVICEEYVVAVTSDGYGGIFQRTNGRLARLFRLPTSTSRIGAYRNRSPFVTGLGNFVTGLGNNGMSLWVSFADGTVSVTECGSFDRWNRIIEPGQLTTSAAQFINGQILLLGFEGRTSFKHNAGCEAVGNR